MDTVSLKNDHLGCFIPVISQESGTSIKTQVEVLAILHIKIMPSYTLCAHACAYTDTCLRTSQLTGLPEAFCQGWAQCQGACCLGQKPSVQLQQSN